MNDLSMKLKLDYTDKNVVDIYPLMRDLRMVKSPAEIDNILKAIEKTNTGIYQLINNLNFDNLEGDFEDYDIDSFWASFLNSG